MKALKFVATPGTEYRLPAMLQCLPKMQSSSPAPGTRGLLELP
jgi:hypothetical protein